MHLFAFDVDGTLIDESTDIMEIARLLDVSLEHVTAFGDSDNDLEMLKHAGHAVQVGDAPYLKDICKEQVSCPLIGLPAWLGRQLEGRS